MIKCNVTVCGTVSKAATCRTNKEGKAFVSFAMNVVIPAKSGINKTIEVSVIKDGTLTEVGSCNIGERIEVAGVLVPENGAMSFISTCRQAASATSLTRQRTASRA